MSRSEYLLLVLLLLVVSDVRGQELVISASHDGDFVGGVGDPVVVIGDLKANLTQPPLVYVTPPTIGTSSALKPHGLSMVSAGQALVTHMAVQHGGLYLGAVDIIDTMNVRRTGTINIPDYQTDGLGTIAVNPQKSAALVWSGFSNNTLFVIAAPFTPTSTVSEITLPSNGGSAQTHAIAFDSATGRAYVGHGGGISVLEPPYTSIAFTIALTSSLNQIRGRAVALSPDGSLLASNVDRNPSVQILHAPFSAGSSATSIPVSNAIDLDGLSFTPDGSQLLVVDSLPAPDGQKVYAISAPFHSDAHVESLAVAPSGPTTGFEDIDISADGNFAALSGGSETFEDPIMILRAPFTASGVRVYPIVIPPQNGGYSGYDALGGRGTGSARFWSEPIQTLPQISVDSSLSLTEGDTGSTPLLVPVRMSRASAATVTVDYATSDQTVTAPSRYLATSGTLTFKPGEIEKKIAIPIVGNTVNDGDGNFFLNFSNPVNATVLELNTKVICTVIDNDVDKILVTSASPLPDAFVGAPYSFTFAASGSATGYAAWSAIRDFSSSDIPVEGLSMNAATGEWSGVPARAGAYYFIVEVFNSQVTAGAFRPYQLTVLSDRIFADGFE